MEAGRKGRTAFIKSALSFFSAFGLTFGTGQLSSSFFFLEPIVGFPPFFALTSLSSGSATVARETTLCVGRTDALLAAMGIRTRFALGGGEGGGTEPVMRA
jgi:hypothetical protein